MKSESNTWKSPIYKIDRSSKTKKCTQKRFFLVKDLQTPLPSKRAVLILWSVIMHYVSRRMKKTPKNIFRFLVFEIWSSWPSRYTLKSEKYLKTNILFFRPISMRISTFQTILRKNEFLLRNFFFLKKSSTKISSTFLFFRWAGGFNFPHPHHSMVKIIKKILRFLFIDISWKMNWKLTFFKTKMTITQKIKIGKIWSFFSYSGDSASFMYIWPLLK